MKFKSLFKNEEDYNAIKEMIKDEELEKFEQEFDSKELDIVPYSRFKEVNDKDKETKNTNDKLIKQIEKLEKEKITLEDFQAEKKKIEDEYEAKIKTIETEAFNVKRDYAIKEALAGARAKHPDLLVKQLDLEKIKEKDGKFEGIDEQIGDMKKTYSDLFESEDKDNNNKANFYSGIRRQELDKSGSKISDIFKEVAWGDNEPEN